MQRQHGAYIYARYSTENQDADSIDVQVGKCTQYCSQRGLPILGVFADEAVSGMKESRPRFDAMMAQLGMGLADTVVCYDQSRLFRKMTAWFDLREKLSVMGVSVISVTQPMVGGDLRDPTIFLTEGGMALFNQVWVFQSRQKVMEKMQHMARNGQHTGGKPPLGYQVVELGGVKKLAILPPEAETVKRIFAEYDSGRSYHDIIAGLNRDGIKTKRGNPFGTNSLHDLLKNEKYIGTLVYGASPYRADGTRNTHAKDGENVIRVEDAIPAIIDKDQFARVQARMAENKRVQGGRPATRREYPLKGKVFCGYCKSAMSVSISRKSYTYYKCGAKKRQHNCSAGNVSVDALEQTVAENVRLVLGQKGSIDKLIAVLRQQRTVIQDNALAQLKTLISRREELRRKLDNAADLVLDGRGSKTLIARMTDMEREQEQLDAKMAALKRAVDASAVPEQTLRRYAQMMADGSVDNLAPYLAIVCRVEVYGDKVVIWTILDDDPTAPKDFNDPGVQITLGVPSGVPMVFVTADLLRIVVAKQSTS